MSTTEIIGIDFGKKYAGTTVIAQISNEQHVTFKASAAKQDADRFIRNFLSSTFVNEVFIDAPLSLPGIYRYGPPFSDYFYRQADREVGGMSPLFLGAMTARAIRLKDQLQASGIQCREVYPAQLAQWLDLGDHDYKGKKGQLKAVADQLTKHFQLENIAETIPDWHHIDALLAAIAGLRYRNNRHQVFGTGKEGRIIV